MTRHLLLRRSYHLVQRIFRTLLRYKSKSCRGDAFPNALLAGVSRSLPVLHGKKALFRFEEVSLCQQPSQWMPGGNQVGIQSGTQGLALKLNGAAVAHWPQNRHPEADMQGAYIPPPSTVFLSLASSWWCKSLAAGLAVLTSSGNVTWWCILEGIDHVLCLCLYVEGDRDREYAPQGDRGSAGIVQPQRTWSQQALGLWGRGMCHVFLTFLIVGKMLSLFVQRHWKTNIDSCHFRLRDRTSMSKP